MAKQGTASTVRPRALQIETSSACQLRCPACPTTSGAIHPAVGTGLLSPRRLERLLADNPDIRHVELSNYGEIFLNPGLVEILRICAERGVEATAVNGVNLNNVRPDTLEAVVRHQLRFMTVSIDGATQATYQKYRVRGKLDRVLSNIATINEHKRRLGSAYPLLRWQFVVFGHNEHELESARAMAAGLEMEFVPKLSWADDFSPVRDPDAVRRATPAGAASRAEFAAVHGRDYAAPICDQLWDSPQVNWNGKLLGCCRNFWGDFGANVFEDGLATALNSERITHARAMLRGRATARQDVPCTTCDIYLGMAKSRRWLVREDVARGQELSADEAVAMARRWLAEGRLGDAKQVCDRVLQAQPGHGNAVMLSYAISRSRLAPPAGSSRTAPIPPHIGPATKR